MKNLIEQYNRLYEICINWAGEEEAAIYTRIAYEFIIGHDLITSLSKYDHEQLARSLKQVIDAHPFECECTMGWTLDSCLICHVSDRARDEIETRNQLKREGVL